MAYMYWYVDSWIKHESSLPTFKPEEEKNNLSQSYNVFD